MAAGLETGLRNDSFPAFAGRLDPRWIERNLPKERPDDVPGKALRFVALDPGNPFPRKPTSRWTVTSEQQGG